MTTNGKEIVLVTGGSGFIGQHIIKMLIMEKSNLNIQQIRSVDLKPFRNEIDDDILHVESFMGDICKPETISLAFKDVQTVFHCAGLIDLSYPVNSHELNSTNIDGTRCIVELCVKHNVKRLIYTSCASVCMVPFKGHSTFSLIINQTESQAVTPFYNAQHPDNFDKRFVLSAYSSSKLRAETIVLNSNDVLLYNKTDYLITTALRPPLTYGEADKHFLPATLNYLRKRNYVYPRISGTGGKQQLMYAGNVAWGHICAYKTLKTSPKSIAGLPVFITDDTPIHDVSRFIQKIALVSGKFKVQQSFWYVPHFLFYFLAFLYELFVRLLGRIKPMKLNYSIRAISSFTASVIMFNRLRAAIHMDYVPLIPAEMAIENTAKWFGNRMNNEKTKELTTTGIGSDSKSR